MNGQYWYLTNYSSIVIADYFIHFNAEVPVIQGKLFARWLGGWVEPLGGIVLHTLEKLVDRVVFGVQRMLLSDGAANFASKALKILKPTRESEIGYSYILLYRIFFDDSYY